MSRAFKQDKRMSLIDMKNRIQYAGGTQDGRNVKAKLNSFKSALWNSYQGEWITYNDKRIRCLINPEKLTTDYDQKILSVEFESGIKPGDTFLWDRTGKHWIVYSRMEEEEAYLRARLRRCDYEIELPEGKYWVWLRGPVETAMIWRQKHKIEMNDLNYSIELFVTKDEHTTQFFQRHQIMKFDGHNWRVAAVDRYSQEGIIEVYLEEYFDNEMLDNMVIPEVKEPDKTVPYIDGPQRVKPYDTDLSFTIVNEDGGKFVVSNSKAKITNSDSTSCVIEITTGRSGEFDLIYQKDDGSEIVLNVTIESF